MQEHTLRSLKLPEFKTLPRAIAIDLDGTLLDSSMQISKRNIRALKTCFVKKIPVILATARAERGVRRLCVPDILENCSLVLTNGAIVKGIAPLSGFHRQKLAFGLARQIVNLVQDFDPTLSINVEIEGHHFGYNRPVTPDELWEINSATPNMVLSIDEALSREPVKVAVNGLGKNLTGLIDQISKELMGRVSVIPSEHDTF
jgi:hydroxymethylpyrimidine pyrophosphatase-like HAD family hydrolase